MCKKKIHSAPGGQKRVTNPRKTYNNKQVNFYFFFCVRKLENPPSPYCFSFLIVSLRDFVESGTRPQCVIFLTDSVNQVIQPFENPTMKREPLLA